MVMVAFSGCWWWWLKVVGAIVDNAIIEAFVYSHDRLD